MTKWSDVPEGELASGLRSLAAGEPTSHPLPEPHLLWLKAQIEERAERRERALRPIVIAERAALVVFALLGGFGAMLLGEWFETSFGQLAESDVAAWTVAGLCILGVGFVFVLKPLMMRD